VEWWLSNRNSLCYGKAFTCNNLGEVTVLNMLNNLSSCERSINNTS
jgi:hypothetical protein